MNAVTPQLEPPFAVMMAGFIVDFHHRNVCSRCQADGSCPRLARAGETLLARRARKGHRAGLMPTRTAAPIPTRTAAEREPQGPRDRLADASGVQR